MTFLRKQWWRILSVHIKFEQIQQQLSGFEPRQILAETIVFVWGMWIKQMGLLSHSCRQLSSSPSYRFTCIHVITINVLMAWHYTGVFNEIWGKNVPISIDYYCYSQMSALLWTWTFTYMYSAHSTHTYTSDCLTKNKLNSDGIDSTLNMKWTCCPYTIFYIQIKQ